MLRELSPRIWMKLAAIALSFIIPLVLTAAFLVNEGKTPTVVFGPGSIADQAHKPDESVATDELVTAAKIYALTILSLVG